MADSSLPLPKYSIWQAINSALSLSMRAIEEVRELAARPEPKIIDRIMFDDITADYDGERTFTFKFTKDGSSKEVSIYVPLPVYKGVWREEEVPYVKGDYVTINGSIYIAQRETRERPGIEDSWKLAVKRGADGNSRK